MQKFIRIALFSTLFAIPHLLAKPARADSPATQHYPPLPSPGPFLTRAADEIAKLPPTAQNQELFFALARAQAHAHDLPALRKTAALIQKNEDHNPDKDAALEKSFQSLTSAWLAGDFALAGDLDTYRAYLAKALADPDRRTLALAYADAHDYPSMLKLAETDTSGTSHFFFEYLARHLANSDPAEAHLLVKKTAQLKPFNNVPVEFTLAGAYADIGDVGAAFAHAQSVPGPSDYFPEVFDDLASTFDEFNRPAAKIARQKYVAAFAKVPQKMQDEQRYSLFLCQIALDDTKAAGQTLDALVRYAQALPQLPDSDEKNSDFLVAAQAAARLGNQKLAGQCLKDAAESIAPTFASDANLMAEQAQQDSNEVAASRARFLAQQHHLDQALAAIATISDPSHQETAIRMIMLDAFVGNDVPTAIAAFAKLGPPDQAIPRSPKPNPIELDRLEEIPSVAHLIVESLLTPRKNDPPIDPAKWIQSLPTPEERAAAAIAIADTLLSPPPAVPVPAEFP